MSHQSGDDPRFLDDLRAAPRRWHRSTMGGVPLAERLTALGRRRQANPRLTQAAALRQTLLGAMAWLRDNDRAARADLVQQRHVEGRRVYRLQQICNLSERSITYDLREARVSLAHPLWAMEQGAAESAPTAIVPDRPPPVWKRQSRRFTRPPITSSSDELRGRPAGSKGPLTLVARHEEGRGAGLDVRVGPRCGTGLRCGGTYSGGCDAGAGNTLGRDVPWSLSSRPLCAPAQPLPRRSSI